MSVIKEMINVKRLSDFGALYWLILIKTILAILAIIYAGH